MKNCPAGMKLKNILLIDDGTMKKQKKKKKIKMTMVHCKKKGMESVMN